MDVLIESDFVMFTQQILVTKNTVANIENNLNEIKIGYPNCSFFLAGDLNARTKDFKDFIPRDDLQYVFGETEYEKR